MKSSIKYVILSLIAFIVFQNFTTFDFAHEAQKNQLSKIAKAHSREVLSSQSKYSIHNADEEVKATDVVQVVFNNLNKNDQHYTIEISNAIIKESQKRNMDPLFVAAVIKTESQFNPYAIGSAGEIGLMQIKPKTAEYLVRKFKIKGYKSSETLKHPAKNIEIGVAYFQYLRNKFQHNSHSYVSAYNMGPLSYRRMISSEDFSNDYFDRVVTNYVKLYQGLNRTVKLDQITSILKLEPAFSYFAQN